MNVFSITLLTITFLSVGSLSSVLIYRLTRLNFLNNDINLFFPRSHCVRCKTQISIINLIPLLGYIIQKGRCINCNKLISITYPMHEVIHLAVGLSIYFFEGITYLSFVTYLIFAICYVLLICDLQNFYLPFYLNIAITLIAFTSAYFDILFISNSFSLNISNISLSIVGFITGYFFLWFINLFYLLLKNKHGIGGGDFILLGGIGSISGPLSLSSIILVGSIGTLTIMLINQKKYSKELPLGAGLILGLFIYVFFKYFELFPYQYVI